MITKRHLSLVFIAVGMVMIGGVLAYDLLKHQPLGERFQLVTLGGGVLIGLLGMLLLPLGNEPV